MITLYLLLIITNLAKLCTDNAFNSNDSPFKDLMQLLSIKIISCFLDIIRMIALLFLLSIFTKCLFYFSAIKQKMLLDKNGKGLSNFNLAIIGYIVLIIVLRSAIFIGTNLIRVIYTLDDSDNKLLLRETPIWIVFRGIIAPLVIFLELSMICYLIFYQDTKKKSDRTEISYKSTKFIKKEGLYYQLDMNVEPA
jgi:hypothetical protein